VVRSLELEPVDTGGRRKVFRIWGVILFFFTTSTFAEIIETSSILSNLPFGVNQRSWIIFDIDLTLLRPEQGFGTERWYREHMNRFQNSGLNAEQAKRAADELWDQNYFRVRYDLAEQKLAKQIEALQNFTTTFALTARPFNLAPSTSHQLNEVKIFFDHGNFPVNFFHHTCFAKGIFYAGQQSKGDLLMEVLSATPRLPQAIWFFDDKVENLRALEHAAQKFGIAFHGFLYRMPSAKKPTGAENPRMRITRGMTPDSKTISGKINACFRFLKTFRLF
jgi:hypothetical protein